VAKKLEVLVDVPEQVDLEWLRGSGPQPHEQLQPEEPATSSQAGVLGALAAAAGTTVLDLMLHSVHSNLQKKQLLHAGGGGWQHSSCSQTRCSISKMNLNLQFSMSVYSMLSQQLPSKHRLCLRLR